jgi:hypothetical protein
MFIVQAKVLLMVSLFFFQFGVNSYYIKEAYPSEHIGELIKFLAMGLHCLTRQAPEVSEEQAKKGLDNIIYVSLGRSLDHILYTWV